MADRKDGRYQHDRAGGSPLDEYEGGYGGGRERADNGPEHAFGEQGWGDGPIEATSKPPQPENTDLPEGVTPVEGGPGWQERFTRENSDKYGQSGGEPIAPRGPGQSTGGFGRSGQGPDRAKETDSQGEKNPEDVDRGSKR